MPRFCKHCTHTVHSVTWSDEEHPWNILRHRFSAKHINLLKQCLLRSQNAQSQWVATCYRQFFIFKWTYLFLWLLPAGDVNLIIIPLWFISRFLSNHCTIFLFFSVHCVPLKLLKQVAGFLLVFFSRKISAERVPARQ